MKIVYENKQQIVTHDTGIIDIFTKQDIEKTKNSFQERMVSLSGQVAELDQQISKIEIS